MAAWNSAFPPIQAAQTAMTPYIQRRASVSASTQCSNAAMKIRYRPTTSACTSDGQPLCPMPGTEQMMSQPHHSPATRSQGVRSQVKSRAQTL